jgi:putative tryptophan/tyrosine transport system substrate-binding protein
MSSMFNMRRRQFISLCGVALARPTAARAQQPRRIGILHSGFPDRTPIHVLFAALRTLGYEDGRTAAIELLGGEGDPDRLNTLVAKLAAQRPDVIIALTPPAVLALKQAGVTTPVVFAFVSDPVGLGIVTSLAHPGANFTGLSFSDAVLGGKRLELLMDALPNLKRVAVIWGRSFAGNSAIFDVIREAARARSVEIFSRELRGSDDLPPAFDDAKASGAQAVIFMTDNVMFGRRREVAALALARHLPSIHSFVPEAEDGGMMSYGPDLDESYRRAAALAGAILKGARPADLPVEEPTRFILAVNLKTAAALDIAIPPAILVRADKVIE